MKNAYYSLLFLALFFVTSCGDDDSSEPLDYGYDYFPTRVGLTRFYQVDSLVLLENSDITDTFSYQVREVLVGTITDNTGDEAIKVERYYRLNDTLDWEINHVFSIKRTKFEAQYYNNNQREVKLAFPVKLGAAWNGLKYIGQDEQEYEIISIEENTELFLIPVDLLTVLQRDDVNFIERKFDQERYVRGVGMVFKEHIDIETQANDTFGVIYRYNLTDYTY